MTDHNQRYIRQLNAGALPWELDQHATPEEEHPIFRQTNVGIQQRSGAIVQPLPQDFEPSKEIVEYLHVYQGVSLAFIAQTLVDFKLYWHETGEARKAWQNKFKSHVIYQWKRAQSEASQRTPQSTVEKLTDRSWAEGLEFDDDTASVPR